MLFLSLVSFVPVLRISSWIRGCLKIEHPRVLQVPKVPWFIISFPMSFLRVSPIFQTPILAPQSAGRTNARQLPRCGQGKFLLFWGEELNLVNVMVWGECLSLQGWRWRERESVYITQELPVIKVTNYSFPSHP